MVETAVHNNFIIENRQKQQQKNTEYLQILYYKRNIMAQQSPQNEKRQSTKY
jgi:hypothetical protein